MPDTPRSAEAVAYEQAKDSAWQCASHEPRPYVPHACLSCIAAALTAHATAAVAAERERCALVLCEHCRTGEPLVDGTYHEHYSEPGDGRLVHWRAGCDARAIRRAPAAPPGPTP